MIIVGAKGFAKEVLQIISKDLMIKDSDIVFFDNVTKDLPSILFNRFKVLKSFEEVSIYLEQTEDKSFVLGLGKPELRYKLYSKFVSLGAIPKTITSHNADIGDFDVNIAEGTNIMSGAIVSNSVTIGKGCLIYFNSVITHDCEIGDFVEISPSVNISGRCTIGSFTSIGTSATILPDVTIGKNVIVGAGTVVLKDVPDNAVIVGVPGKIIKTNESK